MAYTIPTPAYIQALWPSFFADVADATIQAWIDIAATSHDTTWLETDYTYGIALLTAHWMIENGIGAGAQAEANAGGMSAYQTIKSGQLSLTRGATSQDNSGVPEQWGSTTFGTQWYWLARKNRPVAAVALGPTYWPYGAGARA